MLNIALPKGRLGDKVYDMLAAAGYDCPGYYEQNRKLVFESPEKNVRYLLVKPSDVAIYVEHHAADVGIVGKDILLEQGSDVYELLDLNIGKCRMAVAAPEGYVEDKNRTLRVATKYVNITKEFYAGRNRGNRYHQTEREHRTGAASGADGCDRGYRGDREHAAGKPFESDRRIPQYQCAVHCE